MWNTSDLNDNESYIGEDFSPCHMVSGKDSTGVAVVYLVVFFLGLLGNSVVIYVVCLMENRRTSTDIFLMHLAVADLLFSLTLPFWAVYIYTSSWVFGTHLCKLLSGVQEASFYGSVFLLACISIDRYMAIVKATQFVCSQRRVVRLVCGAVWLGACVLAMPVVVKREALLMTGYDIIVCYENVTAEAVEAWRVSLRVLRHTLGFFLPLTVMLFCYSWTVGTLFHSRNSQKHKAMRVILCVVLAFLFCWLPNNITNFIDTLMRSQMIQNTCNFQTQMEEALQVTEALAFTHCAINPILYAFIGKKFRNHFLMSLVKRGLVSRMVLSRYGLGSPSSSGNSRMTSITL
ncbi:C-X-C chemokine receptor type 1 [Electrophorus electricus]|uniref:C-X-C chemokine receptor type 2 n=1 Tax=Electrophorus electricus TaxID=8005 RepID=A0A4W4EUY2_ELEEL|nr:C-X-C chemokine receptor type 1 [Electrophorus electricus]